jgi:hypothetical protein
MFRKLDLFLSSGEEETPTLLGPYIKLVPINGPPLPHLWVETDPVSETVFSSFF